MASAKKSILGVVLAGLGLGGAFIALYLSVLGPRAEARRVRDEVETYGKAWRALRACVVGPEPAAQDGYHAVLARHLLTGDLEPALVGCDGFAARLERPSPDFAGDEVEAAWAPVIKAGQAVIQAQAMAGHASGARNVGAGKDIATLYTTLAAAVAAHDRLYAALRKAVDAPADPPPGPERVAPTPVRLVAADGSPLPPGQPMAKGAVVLDQTSIADRELIYRQTGPDAIERLALGDGVTIAAAGGFGMSVDPLEADPETYELSAADLDERGVPRDAGLVLATSKTHSLRPLFGLGRGEHRVAVWSESVGGVVSAIQLAHWQGARPAAFDTTTVPIAEWPGLAPPAGRGHPVVAIRDEADFADRRWDLIGRAADGNLAWLSLREDNLDARIELRVYPLPEPPDHEGSSCASGKVLWWTTTTAAHRIVEAERPAALPGWRKSFGRLVCDADRLLAVERDFAGFTARAQLCTAQGCGVAGPVPVVESASVHAALLPDGVALVAAANGVAALWTGDPARAEALALRGTYRLPDGCQVAGLAVWPDGPWAVAMCPETTELVPLR